MTPFDFSIFIPSISHATLPEVFLESDSSSASRKRISAMDGSDEQDQLPGLSQRNRVTLPCSSVTLYIFRLSPPSSSALSARSVQPFTQSVSSLALNSKNAFLVSCRPLTTRCHLITNDSAK